MAKIYYGRVSTESQNLARQIEAAERLEIDEKNRFFDKMTGTKRDRPELERMISILKPGDEIYALSLCRLSRSVSDLCDLMEIFQEKDVTVHLEHENMTVDTSTPMGKLSFQLFAVLAEFQRNSINEACREGREAKIAKDGRCGGRKAIPQTTKEVICSMKEKGYSVKEIVEETKLSRASIYNVLKEQERINPARNQI